MQARAINPRTCEGESMQKEMNYPSKEDAISCDKFQERASLLCNVKYYSILYFFISQAAFSSYPIGFYAMERLTLLLRKSLQSIESVSIGLEEVNFLIIVLLSEILLKVNL